MPKKKSKRSKKKPNYFWQWFFIAVVAILLYQGLKEHLFSPTKSFKQTVTLSKKNKKTTPPKTSKEPPTPSTPVESALPQKWTFSSVAPLLPQNVYPDNFQVIPLQQQNTALLAYAKLIAGKKPGPEGQTNTLPALAIMQADGKNFKPQDLPLAPIGNVLGKNIQNKLVGVPQVKTTNFSNQDLVYSVKIFLQEDPQTILSFIKTDGEKLTWVPLKTSKGTTPAIFLEGTSETTTQKVRLENWEGKDYLIIETGNIDLARAYEGYQWQVKAYQWNRNAFVQDQKLSSQLSSRKKKH